MTHKPKKSLHFGVFMIRIAALVFVAIIFQSTASSAEHTGIECGSDRIVRYEVTEGYGRIDDIIIGTETELTSGCITLPRTLFNDLRGRDPKNKAAPATSSFWPGGIIPYTIDPAMNAASRTQIQEASNYFSTYTNIRLVGYSGEHNYVYFTLTTDNRICGSSSVGMVGGGQLIKLNEALGIGCQDPGVLLHELTHALGMGHEVQRTDRDTYVKVEPTCAGDENFLISSGGFGNYDYASLQHYPRSFHDAPCLSPWQNGVIIPPLTLSIPIARCPAPGSHFGVTNGFVVDIGQRCALSNLDHAALNYFYPPPVPPAITVAQLLAVTRLLNSTFFDDVSTLNVDDSVDSKYDALTDGLVVLRYMFGLRGSAMTANAIAVSAARTDPLAVEIYLDSMRDVLDVDNNGTVDALTDGLLILRYMFGLRGAGLITGAIGLGANPGTAAAIEARILSLMP